jgi:hypothetical protein
MYLTSPLLPTPVHHLSNQQNLPLFPFSCLLSFPVSTLSVRLHEVILYSSRFRPRMSLSTLDTHAFSNNYGDRDIDTCGHSLHIMVRVVQKAGEDSSGPLLCSCRPRS